MSPLWQPAELLRTFAKRFIAHRLECFESLPTLLTRIFVGWHEQFSWLLAFRNDAGKSALNKLQFNPRRCLIDQNRPKRMLVRFSDMNVSANRSIRKREGK